MVAVEVMELKTEQKPNTTFYNNGAIEVLLTKWRKHCEMLMAHKNTPEFLSRKFQLISTFEDVKKASFLCDFHNVPAILSNFASNFRYGRDPQLLPWLPLA